MACGLRLFAGYGVVKRQLRELRIMRIMLSSDAWRGLSQTVHFAKKARRKLTFHKSGDCGLQGVPALGERCRVKFRAAMGHNRSSGRPFSLVYQWGVSGLFIAFWRVSGGGLVSLEQRKSRRADRSPPASPYVQKLDVLTFSLLGVAAPQTP